MPDEYCFGSFKSRPSTVNLFLAFLVSLLPFMRILVLGGSGMLGHKLVQCWQGEFDVWTTLRGHFGDYERFGIFDRDKTIDALSALDVSAVADTVERVKP